MAGIVLVALSALWLVRSQLGGGGADGHARIQVGSAIDDVQLHRFGGGSIRLSELGKKVVLINFWASWCEACMVEMPSLVRLREAYRDRGFEIVGVNLDRNPESVVPGIVEQFGIRFPIFVDSDGKLGDVFDLHAIPLTVVVDATRKVLLIESGDRDWSNSATRDLVEKWLNE